MVEAADVHTVGLGGDSEVRVSAIGDLTIGPRRVVPLSLLASQHPEVRGELERQLALESREDLTAQFVLLQRDAPYALSESEGQLLSHLGDGPRSLDWLVQHMRYGSLIMRQVRALEARRLVLRAGFTPTDALHALGRLDVWDVETARLGAQLLAALAGQPLDVFCARVVAGVSDRVTSEMVSKVLADEASLPDWTAEPAAAALLARSLGDVSSSDLDVVLTLKQPMVAIGAPVEAYLPRAAEHLRTELVIPPHAGVANAVGAVAGGVVQQVRVTIQPLDLDLFRVYLPEGVRDFGMLEDAIHHAEEAVTPHVAALARSAGADQVEVTVARVDSDVPVTAGWGENVYLGTELTFTAVGRPGVAV
jgi:N-methylhydantoinase A/oxoprolinase/acetone carboxylase beta subunit